MHVGANPTSSRSSKWLMSRRWRTLFSPRSRGSRGFEPPRRTSWCPYRSSCRTAWAVLHARWSAKPEKLDHLNDPLVLGDAVIEQHRSLTEDLHRALVELLTKWVLGGDQLAERLQRGGEVAPAGVRQRGTEARIAPALTRKGSITPAGAGPGQLTHPQAAWRRLGPGLAARGAGPP